MLITSFVSHSLHTGGHPNYVCRMARRTANHEESKCQEQWNNDSFIGQETGPWCPHWLTDLLLVMAVLVRRRNDMTQTVLVAIGIPFGFNKLVNFELYHIRKILNNFDSLNKSWVQSLWQLLQPLVHRPAAATAITTQYWCQWPNATKQRLYRQMRCWMMWRENTASWRGSLIWPWPRQYASIATLRGKFFFLTNCRLK